MARTPKADVDPEEQVSLLSPAAECPVPEEAGSSSPTNKGAPVVAQQGSCALPEATKSGELGICRICLEEDAVANLESPCGCAGTQRHAHHACIQRWVDEKGNAKCEICEQPYRGGFTVPPAPAAMLENLPLFTPMYILEHDSRAGHRNTLDLLDTDSNMQRNPSVSWCITFIVFFMFLVVLHHTLIVADGMDDDSTGAGGGGVAPTPGAPSGESDGDDEVTGNLLLFLFWVATKAFLIGIPLYTVMRVASRQARREQYEAMLRAGATYESNRRMVIRVRGADVPLATAV